MEIHDWRNWKKEETTFFHFFFGGLFPTNQGVFVCVRVITQSHPSCLSPMFSKSKTLSMSNNTMAFSHSSSSQLRIAELKLRMLGEISSISIWCKSSNALLQWLAVSHAPCKQRKKTPWIFGDSWKLAGKMCEPTKICSQKVVSLLVVYQRKKSAKNYEL